MSHNWLQFGLGPIGQISIALGDAVECSAAGVPPMIWLAATHTPMVHRYSHVSANSCSETIGSTSMPPPSGWISGIT
jgi:hypothetical protein